MLKDEFKANFGVTAPVGIGAADNGGAQPFVATALDDAPVVEAKATAGQLYSLHLTNKTAAAGAAFLLVFNKPAADVIFGTTAPKMAIPLKGDEVKELLFPAGLELGGDGISFAASTSAAGAAGAIADVVATYL